MPGFDGTGLRGVGPMTGGGTGKTQVLILFDQNEYSGSWYYLLRPDRALRCTTLLYRGYMLAAIRG